MKKKLEYFARKLKEVREKKGYSQNLVARRAGIQIRQYGRYENGESAPTLPAIVKLAKALGVSMDLLSSPDFVDEARIKDKKLLGLVEKIDQLDDILVKMVVAEVISGLLAKIEKEKSRSPGLKKGI